jgi:hypothetical protein
MSGPQRHDIDWGDGATGTVVADADNGKESQATAIVRLAHENGVDLWHTPAGDGDEPGGVRHAGVSAQSDVMLDPNPTTGVQAVQCESLRVTRVRDGPLAGAQTT